MRTIECLPERSSSIELSLVTAAGLALLLPGLWTYTLIDPWETHYGEVARSILERADWVRLWWQDDAFRSKPALAPWLIAASLRIHGIADGGGYSGELVSSGSVMWAVRAPFALFGVFGLIMTWVMVARLASRRAAWIAAGVLATTPFYFLIARQAITDIPMVATTIGAIACFSIAIAAEDRPLHPVWWKLDAGHLMLGGLTLAVIPQLACAAMRLSWAGALGPGVRVPLAWLVASAPFVVVLAGVIVAAGWRWRVRTSSQVASLWGYLLVGVGILAKGPPGAVVVAVVVLALLAVTGRWRWLLRARLVEGIAIVLLVAGPWHLAMLLADGPRWASEYFGLHWLARAAEGVHGDRGGFTYFARQLAIGTWPWIGAVPAAVVWALRRGAIRSPRDALRAVATTWALAGFVLFGLIETKFHHYVAPVAPAFALLVGLWIDEARGRADRLAIALGAALVLAVGAGIAAEHEQLIELFIYRHDRPWPSKLSLAGEVWGLTIAATAALVAALSRRARRWAIIALGSVATLFALWAMHRYMPTAAPHWGQRALHRTYHALRQVHGVDIRYASAGDLARAIDDRLIAIDIAPGPLSVGDDIAVTRSARDLSARVEGRIALRAPGRVWIALPPPTAADRSAVYERAAGDPATNRRARVEVDADRLIAWQLFWRGENFWSGGEIYGDTEQTRTVFIHTDSVAFGRYLRDVARPGRRYFLITEAGRAARLRSVLTTERARQTLRVEDHSCNKFTLLSFTL